MPSMKSSWFLLPIIYLFGFATAVPTIEECDGLEYDVCCNIAHRPQQSQWVCEERLLLPGGQCDSLYTERKCCTDYNFLSGAVFGCRDPEVRYRIPILQNMHPNNQPVIPPTPNKKPKIPNKPGQSCTSTNQNKKRNGPDAEYSEGISSTDTGNKVSDGCASLELN